jgi:hypothetical protein
LNVQENARSINKAILNSIEALYVAYVNRIRDADDLNYWITQYKSGMTLNQIGDSFFDPAIAFSE